MISHRFDSFIVFLTVGLSPVLGSWEGADDNHRLNGSLRPYEVSVVYTADGQRIDLLVECWVNCHASHSSGHRWAGIRPQLYRTLEASFLLLVPRHLPEQGWRGGSCEEKQGVWWDAPVAGQYRQGESWKLWSSARERLFPLFWVSEASGRSGRTNETAHKPLNHSPVGDPPLPDPGKASLSTVPPAWFAQAQGQWFGHCVLPRTTSLLACEVIIMGSQASVKP